MPGGFLIFKQQAYSKFEQTLLQCNKGCANNARVIQYIFVSSSDTEGSLVSTASSVYICDF